MSDYRRRDDGSTFDAEQTRDARGRFVKVETPRREVVISRRPGESMEDFIERLGIEASKRIAERLEKFEKEGRM